MTKKKLKLFVGNLELAHIRENRRSLVFKDQLKRAIKQNLSDAGYVKKEELDDMYKTCNQIHIAKEKEWKQKLQKLISRFKSMNNWGVKRKSQFARGRHDAFEELIAELESCGGDKN